MYSNRESIFYSFQLAKTKQDKKVVDDNLPDSIKSWKSWKMIVEFTSDNIVLKVDNTKVWEKKWSDMGVKVTDIKRIGHWHRAYSGSWKQLRVCHGNFLNNM